MKTTIQFKRGSATAVANYTGARKGEPVLDLDNCQLYVCIDDNGTLSLINSGSGGGSSGNAISLRNILIQNIQPQDKQALIYNSISNMYEPQYIEEALTYIDGGHF